MKAQLKSGSDYLPVSTSVNATEEGSKRSIFKVLLRLLLLVGIVGSLWTTVFHGKCQSEVTQPVTGHREPTCTQIDALLPGKHNELWTNLSSTIVSDSFKAKAVDWLSRAVQIPTESWDGMDPVGVDPRWEVFVPFQKYLVDAFPLVHSTLKLTKVNTYGLLIKVQSVFSTKNLPVLIPSSPDVVPVETKTVNEWTHPPFSGHFDGERIWGRGSSDDKSGLIAILSTVETLISSGFNPTRSIVLAFGFDEEVSGHEGAGKIGPVLLDLYGKDGIAFIVDEGAGFGREYETVVATPAIAEKGYLDTRIRVATAGGHSSVPPEHTSIGILAEMLVEYERNPFQVHFARDDPMYEYFQCFAEHASGMPEDLRELILRSSTSDDALLKLTETLSQNRVLKSLLGTTQAIDLISGGIKANALPEQADALVNHRIAVSSSLNETKSRDTDLLRSIAKKYNLTYTAFGDNISSVDDPSQGSLILEVAFDDALEPAPITPTNAAPYKLLSGTIKAAYNRYRDLEGSNNVIVAPGMMTGNTDTKCYWELSPSIFRYNHQNFGDTIMGLDGIHTVNENLKISAFLEMIQFFVTLILNSDESTQL
ncbi:hypothetical protein NP233_g6693 [Leucocoprinus birnbaumii]|uniref:Peptidase M20 dimerisation domain-containing protein n=1 Tax=Leucocoprinus birnbaumii TaxID=56174 RepID=A0AAD5VTX5_9AGAR|nr:hypothetical protein NP233_g6693 [Leucocoprinus birnbaumii]